MALNFELGREIFCSAKHMSLKHFIKVYFSIFSLSRIFVSDLTFNTESDSIIALKTIIFIQYSFAKP